MRKLLFGALALLTMPAVSAQDEDRFDGVYVAADLGVLESVEVTEGIIFNASLGYRNVMNENFIVGIEANYTGPGQERESISGEEDVAINDGMVSVAATAGYIIGANKSTLFSVGAGYATGINSARFSNDFDGILSLAQLEWLGRSGLGLRLRTTTVGFGDVWTVSGGFVFRF